MENCQKFHTVNTELRPADVPADWLIYNATRPLYGTKTWEGQWGRGTHFAAVDPSDPDYEFCHKENASLNAVLLVFVSREHAIAEQRNRYIEKMGERALRFLDDPKNEDAIVERFLFLANVEGAVN